MPYFTPTSDAIGPYDTPEEVSEAFKRWFPYRLGQVKSSAQIAAFRERFGNFSFCSYIENTNTLDEQIFHYYAAGAHSSIWVVSDGDIRFENERDAVFAKLMF